MKRIPQTTFTIGVPGSGKSTFALKLIKSDARYVRVNRDDIRKMIKDAPLLEPKLEDLVTQIQNDAMVNALVSGNNVIVDNTHCRLEHLEEAVELARQYSNVDFKYFPIEVDLAMERDAARPNPVGRAVIERMHKRLSGWIGNFDHRGGLAAKPRPIILGGGNPELPEAVMFDIDGTLAHMQGRSPFDWQRVFEDSPNPIVIEQAKYHKEKGRRLILLSGRDEECRQITLDWMEFHGIVPDDLFMRPRGSFEKDSIVKRRIYETEILGKYNVMAVYDDRLQVIEMWNKLGLFVFNVNQGNIRF
jgi:predicted kinase